MRQPSSSTSSRRERGARVSQLPVKTHAKRQALVPARTALVRVQSAELPKYVTAEEVHAAVERCDRTDVRVLLLAHWYTGARTSEVLAMTVDDIDFRLGTVA